MATNTEILVSKNRGLRLKVEASEGVHETMDDTDNVPAIDLDWSNNQQTEDSNEANFSLNEGEAAITGDDPQITFTALVRGGESGDVTTPPPYDPALQACGWDPTDETVLPSTGSSTVTAGTTSSFTITQASNTDWPTAADDVAALVGRVVQFTANPSSGFAIIASASIATGVISVGLDRVLGGALGATTTLKVLASRVYRLIDASADIVSVSADCFLDGKLHQYSGGRGSGNLSCDGNAQARIAFTLKAKYEGDSDAALPAVADTINAIPAPPRWKAGSAYCDGVPVAVTSWNMDLAAEQQQHRDPNQTEGLLPAKITGRKPRGTIQFNTVLKATKDWTSKVRAGSIVTFGALWNQSGTAGTRIAVFIPQMKFLDEKWADFNGLSDTARTYQALGGAVFVVW